MAVTKGIFERLAKGRPLTKITSKRPQKIQHAQKVLDWLQRWNKPVVHERDFRVFGPRPRNRESAINAARILAERGWLRAIPTRRYDSHAWQVIQKPIILPQL